VLRAVVLMRTAHHMDIISSLPTTTNNFLAL
jgi:hypothetical protein